MPRIPRIVFVAIAAIVAVSVFFLFKAQDKALGLASSEFQRYASDVVGSHTGTSTVSIAFNTGATGGQSATSSYVSKIGADKGIAIYTLQATTVSSSANLQVDFQGSNDDYCWTTNTSAAVDLPLVSDINWYSAGDHLKDVTHSDPFSMTSSTKSFTWNNPRVKSGAEVILTDLNYECLRLNVSGSSTEAFVQIRTK